MAKHGLWVGALALAGLAAAAFAATFSPPASAPANNASSDPQKNALPPLVVDTGAPLTLEEGPGPVAPAAGPSSAPSLAADNSPCLVCHGNMKEEPLARSHAEAAVGCVACHGESGAHEEDEDNTTPPDVMFAPEAIAPLCQRCHIAHDAPATAVIARWLERCPQKKDPDQIVCTDCHGTHRLAVRTVRWDKKTRQLLDDAPSQ